MNKLMLLMLLMLLMFALITGGTLFAQDAPNFFQQIDQHRKEYKENFLTNERSPFYDNKEALKHFKFFEAKPGFVIEANYELTLEAGPFQMATYSGQVQPYQKYAILTFELDGKIHELSVYRSLRLANLPGYKDYLFLPFKDITNGELTYGGGRYIDLKTADFENGKVTIDFNKTYNPWCMYADGYNCPIPPAENHLEVAIYAGERTYPEEHLNKK